MAAVSGAGQCRFEEATVVKAIHAICVSPDGKEFPAAHMTGDTWINSGYEGEVARCLPGTELRAMVGSVAMSSMGMTTSMANAEVLSCGPGQALRHYKDGMLKCAVAEKVPDCTERNNLRKWGTGDMFFTYRTRVCATGGGAQASAASSSYQLTAQQRQMAADAAQAKARELKLSGMRLTGGVGQGGW